MPSLHAPRLRVTAIVLVTTVLAAATVLWVPAEAAYADEHVELSGETTPAVLAGEDATVRLAAASVSEADHYNVAMRYELPVGVRYVPGSTTPSSAGEPRVVTIVTVVDDEVEPPVTEQHEVLIWVNVADLRAGDDFELGFAVSPDAALYPVGARFDGVASVFASADPRVLPKFDAAGEPLPAAGIASAEIETEPSAVSAVSVDKGEPSAEAELLRGVHTQSTVYTLSVRNTTVAPTEDVVVVDYLPAALEFLGCGGDDFSAGEEYAGSGPRDAPLLAGCVEPDSVETVVDPAEVGAGVFTKVTWSIGTLGTEGEPLVIRYAAGIPLRANAAWSGTAPTPTSLRQGSNLDNNTGPSTRQAGPAAGVVNTAVVTGDYTGPLAPGGTSAVRHVDRETVEASDLSIVKSSSTSTFSSGDVATFTLDLRAGEYASVSGMEITDVIPDGLCPLVPTGTPVVGGPLPDDCTAPGTIVGADIQSVTVEADGTFTVVLLPHAETLDPDGSAVVRYPALMRTAYGEAGAVPTVSGDSFRNVVDIAATTTSARDADGVALQDPLTRAVDDDSSAGLGSLPPTIDKRILPPTTGTTCPETGYLEPADGAVPRFGLGDRVCFELRVEFSAGTVTRGAEVTDFLPVSTRYEDYAVVEGDGRVPAEQVVLVGGAAVDAPTWAIGEARDGGRFVAPGLELVLLVSAIVADASSTAEVDITANLMKYRQESTAGRVLALRDQVDLGVAPPPVVDIEKHVVAGGLVDQLEVGEGQTVGFRLDVRNLGTADDGTDVPLVGIDVRDVLPPGFDCADVAASGVAISHAGVCTDEGGRGVLEWSLDGPVAPGATHPPVTYSLVVPSPLSVSTSHVNTAAVVGSRVANTAGGRTEFTPVQPVEDSATLTLPSVSVAKSGVTSIVETNNNAASQATQGERITYTVTVTVPARTSVLDGTLTDPLPSGLVLDGTSRATVSLPAGAVAEDFVLSPVGALDFPDVWTNATDDPAVFTVTLADVLVATTATTGNKVNTARFTSAAPAGAAAIPARTAAYTINVREPDPRIEKVANPSSVSAGQTVTFTVKAWTSSSNRPPLHDAAVVDCLPAGLTFTGYGSLPAGVTTQPAVPGDGANGCASGATRLAWDLGDLQPSAGSTDATKTLLAYTATVSSAAAGAQSYANTATLRGTSVDGGGKAFSRAVTATVNVNTATVVKSVEKPRATIGEVNEYTIRVTLPPRVNFYDAAVIDVLPAGVVLDGPATVTCEAVGAEPCVLPGGGTPLPASGARVGWLLGDLLAAEQTRTVTVTVPVIVADIPATGIGTSIANTARLGWSVSDQESGPSSAGATFSRTTSDANVSFIATGPDLAVAKAVSDPTPGPGDILDYTVRVTNAGGADNTAAYDVTVVDAVPVGVVVDADSLVASGGVLTGAGADGGGTVTWTLDGPVAPGATVDLAYRARLAASASIDADPLVNSVDIPSYSSLADGGRVYDDVTPATATVTPEFPHITLGKRAQSPDIAYAGEPFSWTLTLDNVGGALARTVSPVDLLPANWRYVDGTARVSVGGAPATALEPDVTAAGDDRDRLSWAALGPLAPGGSIVITYQAVPLPAALLTPGVGASVPHVNTLTASATDATAAGANAAGPYASATAATDSAEIHSADLTIVKTAGDPLVAGETASAWRIVVSNAGPDAAVGTAAAPFRVVDTPGALPEGVSVVGASGSGWACTVPTATGAFECTRSGSLAAGASFPAIVVAMRADTAVPRATELQNSASVAARTHDPVPENNSTESIQVDTRADLAVTKTADGPVRAGRSVSWTIGLTNLGPSVSRGPIELTDTLPSGLSAVTATGPGWECEVGSGEVVCVRDADLGVGPAGAITVTGVLASSVTGDIANAVAITDRRTVDPVSSNDTAIARVAADTATSLALTKTLVAPVVDGTPTIEPGEVATYEFTVRNTGAADARSVELIDPLPSGLELADGSVESVEGAWSCTGTTTVTCVLGGTLPATPGDAVAVVRFGVTVPSGLTGPVDNTATVSAANASGVVASALDPTTPRADFALAKSHPEGAVVAGTSVTYTLTATNLGPSDDPGPIRVVDTVPAGMTPTAASGRGWDCGIEGAVVTCLFDSGLEASEVAPDIRVVTAVASSAGPGTLINAATVTGSLPSTGTSRASTTDATAIVDDAVVTIDKSAVDDVVRAGRTAAFTLEVVNAGPSDADAVTVSDVLPAGLTATSIEGDGWSCTLESLVCVRETLAPGASRITVVAAVASSVPDATVLTNQATVDWRSGTETRRAADSAAVTVVAEADLALSKSADEPAVDAGESAVFTLAVANLGPSDAAGPLVIVDTLPPGLSYLGAGAGWACSAADATTSGQVVTCALADRAGLVAGDDVALRLVTQVDAALSAGTSLNVASVSAATADPVTSNDSAAAPLAVGQLADLSIVKSHAAPARIGEPLDFDLAVRNDGPSVATRVVVVDELPPGLRYAGAGMSDPAWSCAAEAPTPAGTEVTCSLATPLSPSTDAPALVISTEVEAAAYPQVVNVAAVSSAVAEADAEDTVSRDRVAVAPLVALTVEKQHVGEVRVGELARYDITVGNAGPTEEPGGFRVVDELPVGLQLDSVEGDDVACGEADGVVTCEFDGALPVGGERAVTLVVRVLPTAPAELVNVATATSPFHVDTLPVRDEDTATVLPPHPLAMSGVAPALLPAAALLALGLLLALVGRRVAPGRRPGENGA